MNYYEWMSKILGMGESAPARTSPPAETYLSARPPVEPGQAAISARHPYEVTMPYNQVGPFPMNMAAGSPRGEVAYDPRSYAKEAALNLPPMAGIYAGKKALGYATAPNKFSNLADKMERFEIDDSMMKLKPGSLEGEGTRFTTKMGTKLSDVIYHPELFKNYPFLKDVKVDIRLSKVGAKARKDAGTGSWNGNELFVAGPDEASIQDVLTHEIQHAIQEYEGFAKGGTVATVVVRRDIQNDIRKLTHDEKGNIRSFGMNTPKDIKDWKEVEKLKKLLDSPKLLDLARDRYERLAGEIEARDAAFRRLYTPYERQAIPPYSSEDIALKDWIVNK